MDLADAWKDIPIGAKMSWSNATLFRAGTVPDFDVMGNVVDKKLNHLC